MVLLYRTRSGTYAREIEATLVDDYWEGCDNSIGGGGGSLSGPPHFSTLSAQRAANDPLTLWAISNALLKQEDEAVPRVEDPGIRESFSILDHASTALGRGGPPRVSLEGEGPATSFRYRPPWNPTAKAGLTAAKPPSTQAARSRDKTPASWHAQGI